MFGTGSGFCQAVGFDARSEYEYAPLGIRIFVAQDGSRDIESARI